MNLEQANLVFGALTKTGRGRSNSAVSKETGVPLEDVERMVTFIKSSPLFRFTLTSAGLLVNLEVRRLARGAYSHVVDSRGCHMFYIHGKYVAKFEASDSAQDVQHYADQHQAEAAGAGALYYAPELERWDVVAPRVVECLALMPA
jgi:hypothetical protein